MSEGIQLAISVIVSFVLVGGYWIWKLLKWQNEFIEEFLEKELKVPVKLSGIIRKRVHIRKGNK